MPTIFKTSFSRNVSLRWNDNAACAFLNMPIRDEAVRFPVPTAVRALILYVACPVFFFAFFALSDMGAVLSGGPGLQCRL